MEQQLYIRIRGKVQGPFSYEKLQGLARRGQFSRLHEVSEDGANWVRASNYPDLFVSSPPAVAVTALQPQPEQDTVDSDEEGYAIAGQGSPPASPREQTWYYGIGSAQQGPVGFAMLQMLASTGQLAPDDLVWTDGMPEWTPAHRVPGLVRSVPTAPAVSAPAASPASRVDSSDSPRPSGLAIASLTLGIFGLLIPVVGSVMAVVFGHVALGAIHRSKGRVYGSGMAVGGLTLGYLEIVTVGGYFAWQAFLLLRDDIAAFLERAF